MKCPSRVTVLPGEPFGGTWNRRCLLSRGHHSWGQPSPEQGQDTLPTADSNTERAGEFVQGLVEPLPVIQLWGAGSGRAAWIILYTETFGMVLPKAAPLTS